MCWSQRGPALQPAGAVHGVIAVGFYTVPHMTVFWRQIGRTMKILSYWVQINVLQVSEGCACQGQRRVAVDGPELEKMERWDLIEQKKFAWSEENAEVCFLRNSHQQMGTPATGTSN